MNVKKIISSMTLEDKIKFCSGADYWHTEQMKQYGIPAVMMADGPHGLRKQTNASDMLGINQSVKATCFPTAALSACSWDEELLFELGGALGNEAAANDVSLVLGPGANLKRNPLCGRNFEYFSEDPYLTGKMAAAHIRGVQSTGVSACIKHFAANSQEHLRFSSDSIMDERTLREMYLTGFEIAVKEAKPAAVMCAYNQINGEYCSDNRKLLTKILREEWGFDGMVVTDWGAMSDRIKGFQAGCDLSMPGGSAYMEKEALEAVKTGKLSEADIDICVERILQFVEKSQNISKRTVDMEGNHVLACKIAEESAVLLKNDDRLLPLSEKADVVWIGHMAEQIRYQGSGSSHINPWKMSNIVDICPEISYVQGCDVYGKTNEEMLKEAVCAAKKAKVAVVFAGLTDQYESEGFDRKSMRIPKGHAKMIRAVAEVNPNTVVVLFAGSPVEISWADKVKSILYMGLPGQAGAQAAVKLLFGKAIPCGKLAETWSYKYEDCISSSYYVNGKKDAHYREGVYVGYRYYKTANKPVRFPFGHGLSYTTFVYSDLKIDGEKVSCSITNTGNIPAKEIVQLYITPPKGAFYRPVIELKGFCKIALNPGETKEVQFELSDRSFAIWNQGWMTPGGNYLISIGSSSEDLRLTGTVEKEEVKVNVPKVPQWYFTLDGEPSHQEFEKLIGHTVKEKELKKGEFTMHHSVMELRQYSFIMKILFKVVENIVAKGFDGKKDYKDPTFRMMLHSAAGASLSGMKINGGMKNYLIEGMLDISNGHLIKGVAKMCKKI